MNLPTKNNMVPFESLLMCLSVVRIIVILNLNFLENQERFASN